MSLTAPTAVVAEDEAELRGELVEQLAAYVLDDAPAELRRTPGDLQLGVHDDARARALGLEVVAEGVETQEQEAFLRAHPDAAVSARVRARCREK